MVAFFSNFSQKLQNTKMPVCRKVKKTVRDRAISTKFLTHRVSLQSSLPKCQKMFVLPKMAAILNFRIFSQKLQI